MNEPPRFLHFLSDFSFFPRFFPSFSRFHPLFPDFLKFFCCQSLAPVLAAPLLISDSNRQLKHYQHGFRQKHSRESQFIITMKEKARVLGQIKNRNHIDMPKILDFSNSSDTVPYTRLLYKIDYSGQQFGYKHGLQYNSKSSNVWKGIKDIHVESGRSATRHCFWTSNVLLNINDVLATISLHQ